MNQAANPPDFLALLRDPLVRTALPQDFDAAAEAEHLRILWRGLAPFRQYSFVRFIHAGGSGMVFRVSPMDSPTSVYAMKVARRWLTEKPPVSGNEFSPVSSGELKALRTLSHPNVVQLHDAIEFENGVVAIVTGYVDDPRPLDEYLIETLSKDPDPSRVKGLHAFSPERLDHACEFLVQRCTEIASALAHMHKMNVFHFDVKPANILLGKVGKTRVAVLTDLGSCIDRDDLEPGSQVRVNFTWTYAHPSLQNLLSSPRNITGGLKASAEVPTGDNLERYDLFAFGRTMQRALAILYDEFGERCFSTYGFRYLHLVSCLLLDGENAPVGDRYVISRDGSGFVNDDAMRYDLALFSAHKIGSAEDLLMRLGRFTRSYSWFADSPELDPWQANVVNTGIGFPSPFTVRVSAVLTHPAVRRLKSEFQLGWMRELYPGATHNRWSHTIGVFSSLVDYYNSMLSDADIPTLRILADKEDVSHAIIAGLLHDIGQTDFAHDFEAACPDLFNHKAMIARLLDDTYWSESSLRTVISRTWPEIDLDRVLGILGYKPADKRSVERIQSKFRPLDGIARDVIDGPVDADKFDYLARDSVACGVAYGLGIDRPRFLQSLTVDEKRDSEPRRLALAYRAKGAAAIESLLLARYQMYGGVYWHHTYRCIQAMFTHAVASTFGEMKHGGRKRLRDVTVRTNTVSDLLYHRVVCRKPDSVCVQLLGKNSLPSDFALTPPPELANEPALEVVWRLADDSIRDLVLRLARRQLYKRIYELQLGDLPGVQYTEIRERLLPGKRPQIGRDLSDILRKAIYKEMQGKQANMAETVTESEARKRLLALEKTDTPLVVVDFPVRGIPDEHNYPEEVADPARKYISGYGSRETARRSAFAGVKQMQAQAACVRVFAEPDLHELVVRYLNPGAVRACVEQVLPVCRPHR